MVREYVEESRLTTSWRREYCQNWIGYSIHLVAIQMPTFNSVHDGSDLFISVDLHRGEVSMAQGVRAGKVVLHRNLLRLHGSHKVIEDTG